MLLGFRVTPLISMSDSLNSSTDGEWAKYYGKVTSAAAARGGLKPTLRKSLPTHPRQSRVFWPKPSPSSSPSVKLRIILVAKLAQHEYVIITLGDLFRRRRPTGPRRLGRPARHQGVALNRHFRVPLEPNLCEQRFRDHDPL